MTLVKELIEELKQLPEDALIVMSKDSEGNRYSPLSGIDISLYVADSTWSGDIYLTELTDELRAQGYSEEDLYDGDDDAVTAVVLWPIN